MNFRFKLSQRLARMKWGTMLAGALAFGCKLTDAGPVVARIDGIDVSPPRLSLLPAQSAELTITVHTSRGDSGAAASLQWSTSGGVITNNFLLDGVRHITYQSPSTPGTYFLIVTTVTGNPADTASIAVATTPVPVSAVTVSPGTLTLAVGDTTRLRATLSEASGSVVVGRLIEWSTSDAGVVTVLATGAIRAVGPGTATITATSEEHSGSALITVNPGP
ncbi:MAG TPA: Ig-like domain-containing protein [Gemmatimonadales bacterium]|nr:Ig-like domain-containing protein [Gemmatimonadales bacterium]